MLVVFKFQSPGVFHCSCRICMPLYSLRIRFSCYAMTIMGPLYHTSINFMFLFPNLEMFSIFYRQANLFTKLIYLFLVCRNPIQLFNSMLVLGKAYELILRHPETQEGHCKWMLEHLQLEMLEERHSFQRCYWYSKIIILVTKCLRNDIQLEMLEEWHSFQRCYWCSKIIILVPKCLKNDIVF